MEIFVQTKKQSTEIFRICQKNIKLNVVFRSFNRMTNDFPIKDQTPKYTNLDVIYKYKCNICSDVYIGETKPHFLVPQMSILGNQYLPKRIYNIPKKMPLLLESIVTPIVKQLIHPFFY